MKLILITLPLMAGAIVASDVVLYNPASSPVTNRVTAYLRSADTPQYAGNVLVNPSVPNSGTPANGSVEYIAVRK